MINYFELACFVLFFLGVCNTIYSSHRRTGDELDNEAHAFKPVLGSMLGRIYHNPQIKEENQLKLQQILQLWASNSIYDQDTISALRNEMIGGISANSFSGPSKELSTASAEPATGIYITCCA